MHGSLEGGALHGSATASSILCFKPATLCSGWKIESFLCLKRENTVINFIWKTVQAIVFSEVESVLREALTFQH